MVWNNICRGRALRIAVGIAAVVLLMAGGAGGATLTVDDSGGADYTGIQDAINAASAGDTIEVYSGLYFENVVVDKQLELRGQDNGGGMPVVNAMGSGNAITITASGVILDGFDAKYGVSYSGITVTSKNNVIINNNASGNNYGIYLSSSSNNTLSGNNASNNYYGIYLYSSSNNTLSGNNASNNGYGIYLSSSSNNTLSGNNANSNNYYGIYLSYSSNTTLSGNNANSNNYYGISLYSASNDNTLSGNTINSNKHGIYLSFSFKNTLSRNTINSNNEHGIYLDSSSKNSIYNNLFNNSNNYYTPETTNNWNISKTAGTNIIGGSYLGGNFWANPSGTGFSQTCADADSDGICDSSYILDEYNIDYLPLAYKPDDDTTPPSSITNLKNMSYASTYINWTWNDPSDSDFSKVMIYIDGSFKTNVSKEMQYYNAAGFAPDTSHTISTRTVDLSGNINQTWVNHTATTNSSGEIKGDLNRNGRRDTGDATLTLRSIVELPIPSEYLPVLPAGDMNCNSRIDTGDATLILRDVVSLPIPRCWE